MSASDSIDTFLMNSAWKRLWTPGTPYYLPDAMLKGVHDGNVNVDAFGNMTIANIGPIPLMDSDTWGSISLTLSGSQVTGISAVTPGAFNYDDNARTFNATINWGPLDFNGAYSATGGGVVGCAMATGKFLLGGKTFAVRRRHASDAIGDNDPQIQLAQNYRDQLVAQPSGAGLQLVSSYYDNNDTLNEICAGDNVFTFQWPKAQTSGLDPNGAQVTVNSSVLADQTTASAQQPNNPAIPVGYDAYSKHSYKMQGVMIVALQQAMNSAPPEEKARYVAAMQATLGFKNATAPRATTQTVGQVMSTVAGAPPQEPAALLAANAILPWQEEIDREVGRLVEEYEEHKSARLAAGYAPAADGTAGDTADVAFMSSTISGNFDDSISNASVNLSGTVTISGTMPNITLTVAITDITATLPTISIHLSGSGGMLDAVQNYIAASSWFQGLLKKQIANALEGDDLKNYLSDRMNQSLAKVFGGN